MTRDDRKDFQPATGRVRAFLTLYTPNQAAGARAVTQSRPPLREARFLSDLRFTGRQRPFRPYSWRLSLAIWAGLSLSLWLTALGAAVLLGLGHR